MSEINDGGPAFPVIFHHRHGDGSTHIKERPGMTLRDYFAAHALMGMNASPALFEVLTTKDADEVKSSTHRERLAKHAYLQADAMLREREKGGQS